MLAQTTTIPRAIQPGFDRGLHRRPGRRSPLVGAMITVIATLWQQNKLLRTDVGLRMSGRDTGDRPYRPPFRDGLLEQMRNRLNFMSEVGFLVKRNYLDRQTASALFSAEVFRLHRDNIARIRRLQTERGDETLWSSFLWLHAVLREIDKRERSSGRETITIESPVASVWSVLSEVTRERRWGAATTTCTWTCGATSRTPHGLGAGCRFRRHHEPGAKRWSTKGEIVAWDEAIHQIAFQLRGWFQTSTRWTYTATPIGIGTELEEHFEVLDGRGWPGGPGFRLRPGPRRSTSGWTGARRSNS